MFEEERVVRRAHQKTDFAPLNLPIGKRASLETNDANYYTTRRRGDATADNRPENG